MLSQELHSLADSLDKLNLSAADFEKQLKIDTDIDFGISNITVSIAGTVVGEFVVAYDIPNKKVFKFRGYSID